MQVADEYIRLAFRLNKHVVGLVDSYFGPDHLKREVEAEGILPLAKLKEQCVALKRAVGDEGGSEDYQIYMLKQLEALQAQIDGRLGLVPSFQTYVRRLFDVDAGPADETELGRCRQDVALLLSQLGYAGNLRDDVRRWEEDQVIGGQAMFDLIHVFLRDARSRTRQMIGLAEGEDVSVEAVHEKPWSGYNWYQGKYRSLIQINLDLPRTRLEIEDLVTHEAYPGHHTDHSTKEKHLYVDRGILEASILLINTPSSVIGEGLASYGNTLIYRSRSDPAHRLARLLRKLRRACDVNACLMLHAQGLDRRSVQRYLESSALLTPQRAEKRLEFLTDPLWRAYTYTYWKGERLIEQAWSQAERAGATDRVLDVLYKELLCPTTLVKRVNEIC